MVGHPSWSPDGQWIIFHARPEGPTDIFVVPAAGGPTKRLTTNSWEDHYPSYSRDGRSIFFSSRRSGEMQIWRMAAGRKQTRYRSRPRAPPIIRRSRQMARRSTITCCGTRAKSGASRFRAVKPVKVAGPTQRFPVGFTVTAEGVYYGAPPHAGDERFIRFFNFSTGTEQSGSDSEAAIPQRDERFARFALHPL